MAEREDLSSSSGGEHSYESRSTEIFCARSSPFDTFENVGVCHDHQYPDDAAEITGVRAQDFLPVHTCEGFDAAQPQPTPPYPPSRKPPKYPPRPLPPSSSSPPHCMLLPDTKQVAEGVKTGPGPTSQQTQQAKQIRGGVRRGLRSERVTSKKLTEDFIYRLDDKNLFQSRSPSTKKLTQRKEEAHRAGKGTKSELPNLKTVDHMWPRIELASNEASTSLTWTPWRCLECNIFFNCPQALGGHKKNSRDHQRRVAAMLKGDSSFLRTMPRHSSQVYSFEEDSSPGGTRAPKRAKKAPMTQLACYDTFLEGFSRDVQETVAGRKSSAAFFASCSLEVFKNHVDFGDLAVLAINDYFHGPCENLEGFLDDNESVWEFLSANNGPPKSATKVNELHIFSRMLVTKKRFLDINRRAVSKRLKKMRDKDSTGNRLKQMYSGGRRSRSKK